jgi:hypothetical protein
MRDLLASPSINAQWMETKGGETLTMWTGVGFFLSPAAEYPPCENIQTAFLYVVEIQRFPKAGSAMDRNADISFAASSVLGCLCSSA